ncbi:MAG: hypothetical protein LBC55_00185, partial [Desulfovibrio sp.]|nr:hypothetical protein [Desulfovibrio sp.]
MSESSLPQLQSSPVIDSILAAIFHPIVCIDRQGLIRLCNDALPALLCRKREEIVGRHIDECVPGNRLSAVLATKAGETWGRFAFGDRDFLISHLPMYIDGQLVGALAELHEVSDLERISGELNSFRILSEELEGIIDTVMDGIYVADGQGVTLRISESCRRITGL